MIMGEEEIVNKLFSPFNLDSSPIIVGWVMYDWTSSVTIIPFSVLFPLLINELGDSAFGTGTGRILWSYLSAAMSILTAILYLSATSVIEFGNMKCKALLRCGLSTSISLLLFVFCFSPGSVYLACILAVISVCIQRVGSVAYDSLLDAVSLGKDAHQISARGFSTSYIGIIFFLIFLAIVMGIFYAALNPSVLWLTEIIPIVCSGIWYLFFLHFVSVRLPVDIGSGPPLPEELRGNIMKTLFTGFLRGIKDQFHTLLSLYHFSDLGLFMLAMAFISDAAASASSAAVIIASSVLNLSLYLIAAALLIGIIGCIIGLAIFKTIHCNGYLQPKQIIIINSILLCLIGVYVLNIQHVYDVFIIAGVAGTQIGPLGSFSRSIVSHLIPSHQQSRFFSLFDLTQKGSSWLGPLVIAALTQSFGDNSYVLVVVVVSVVEVAIGLPILFAVNITRGESIRSEAEEEVKTSVLVSQTEKKDTEINECQYGTNTPTLGKKDVGIASP